MTSAPVSKKVLMLSYVLAMPPVVMLLISGVMKIMQTAEVVKGFATWPAGSAVAIGLVELVCTILYLVPRTAVLGGLLLVGYLGGAVAVTVQMGGGAGWLMPALFGGLLWGALWLREPRLRALLPLLR